MHGTVIPRTAYHGGYNAARGCEILEHVGAVCESKSAAHVHKRAKTSAA